MDKALRALKYVRIPGVTIAMACARYGLTRAQYTRARKERGHEVTWTLEDIILGALAGGGEHDAASLVEYVDWQDHCRYTPRALESVLAGLAARGLVERAAGGWRLLGEWP